MSDGGARMLAAGPTGRYLVGADGQPVFVNGDTAWSILVSVSMGDATLYLDDRRARGFNAVIVNAIEHLFAPDPPRTIDGIEPFQRPGDLTVPNEAYFGRIDRLLELARERGITVFLAPLYLGYHDPHYPGFGGRAEGWHGEVLDGGPKACRSYGAYLGSRWRDVENLVWVIGGDRNPGDVLEHMRAFVAGIRSVDDRHLITAHVHPESSPVEEYEGDPWLTLNQTYSYQLVHRQLLLDDDRTPIRPFVLFESTYEGEHDASDLQIRRQAWWALTCGATGSFLGNYPVWLMPPGWTHALDSEGARAMTHLGSFVAAVRWWELRPDRDDALLVAGHGERMGLDLATAAVSPDGGIGVIYVPTERTITVRLDRMAGWITQARWFDPVRGDWVDAGVYPSRGFRQFTSPSGQDWVLLLEARSAGDDEPWAAGS